MGGSALGAINKFNEYLNQIKAGERPDRGCVGRDLVSDPALD